MRRQPISVFLFAIFLPSLPLFSQNIIFSEPQSNRIANYGIAVSLNDTLKTLDAEVKLIWENPSRDTIPDLQFHLYLNAFKNAKSTFSKESNGSLPLAKRDGWGWSEISRMAVRGADHSDKLKFIAPDDGNADDQTVLQVMLDQPVLPGETVEIDYSFQAKIPRNHRRTGWWGDDFFFMVQWFPKIGVYETPGMRLVPIDAPRGQWNCHQFHPNTEFYADFGVYDVQITAPVKYTIAATGVIQRERLNEDHSKTVFVHAEDVHDFAWLADATVLDFAETWNNKRTGQMVKIRLLLQPGHESAKSAYLESAKYTLQYFDDWLGEGAYPYPQLTIVDPQPGSSAGGMEYPTLITGGVFSPARWWTRNKIRIVETVTIHELAHQYWYGMVANNEFEEAFLDEGFTTYSENRIGAEMFGKRTSMLDFAGLKVSMEAMRRPSYTQSKGNRDATISDFSYATRGSRNLAYNKWSLALKTLE
ncbi:MAG: M1 family metallopeptidase, partial [bacterium]